MKKLLLTLVVCVPTALAQTQDYYVRFDTHKEAAQVGATQPDLMPEGVHNWYHMTIPDSTRQSLADELGKPLAHVLDTGVNMVTHTHHTNDPMAHHRGMWGQDDMLSHTARPLVRLWTRQKVTVGVLDSGVARGHPDLTRLVDGYTVIPGSDWGEDGCAHGTHVAGTICADTNNNIGVAGLNPHVGLVSLKALDGCNGSLADVVDMAVIGGAVFRCDIITMSLQWSVEWLPWLEAVDYLESVGTLLVVATGNSFSVRRGYAARHPWIIAVGAHTIERDYAFFTNREADLYAAGVGILSTNVTPLIPGPQLPTYNVRSGTSMATPHVTSVLAAMISVFDGYERNNSVATVLRSQVIAAGDRGLLDAPHLNAARAILLVLPCAADWDRNDTLDIFDFLSYQRSFVLNETHSDLNADGVLDIFDFLAFQSLFTSGQTHGCG